MGSIRDGMKKREEIPIKKVPRKRDREVVQVAEAMGVTLSADIMTLEDLRGFPMLRDMNEKDKAILCLNACGFSQAFIAKAMGVTQQAIFQRLEKCDPERVFSLSPKSKKAFMTRLAESRGLEALAYLSPEKLEDSSANELINIAGKAVDISQKDRKSTRLNSSHSQQSRMPSSA